MPLFGCALAMLASFFLVLGLIPFLGWLNWFTSLPLALVATLFFYLDIRDSPRSAFSQVGLLLSMMVLCVVIFRLSLGGGLI